MAMGTMKRLVLGLALATILGEAAPGPAIGADAPAIDRNVGQRMPDFTLKNTSGEAVRLYAYALQRKKAVVLIFTGISCPVSDVYPPRLAELAKEYEPKGVVFLAINSNAQESAEEVAKHAKEHGITFPVLKD